MAQGKQRKLATLKFLSLETELQIDIRNLQPYIRDTDNLKRKIEHGNSETV